MPKFKCCFILPQLGDHENMLTSIREMKIGYIHYDVYNEIIYPCTYVNGSVDNFGNG